MLDRVNCSFGSKEFSPMPSGFPDKNCEPHPNFLSDCFKGKAHLFSLSLRPPAKPHIWNGLELPLGVENSQLPKSKQKANSPHLTLVSVIL